MTLAFLSTSTTAFTPRFLASQQNKYPQKLKQVKSLENYSPDTDEDETSSGWISWMARGRKSNSLIYREPEELGGIARTSRYSARYA
jgi:hypothetical protein